MTAFGGKIRLYSLGKRSQLLEALLFVPTPQRYTYEHELKSGASNFLIYLHYVYFQILEVFFFSISILYILFGSFYAEGL